EYPLTVVALEGEIALAGSDVNCRRVGVVSVDRYRTDRLRWLVLEDRNEGDAGVGTSPHPAIGGTHEDQVAILGISRDGGYPSGHAGNCRRDDDTAEVGRLVQDGFWTDEFPHRR